ncbi:unnamed protein product, partial [Didymodactylos carnosus]
MRIRNRHEVATTNVKLNKIKDYDLTVAQRKNIIFQIGNFIKTTWDFRNAVLFEKSRKNIQI